ncbi:regulatory protein RecX [Roseateles saccharophilus]|uniref:Regulatory protein RecX n=1 Tax=Roseateles saccharophilus TaxID=304 RepID=A0A4V2VPJ6_ROSSA|nr:regulatory protein RecX [Roseateles saccharophilus]MDG0834041.1 regulatory protein RecX [Roseateles saccharophilus]TCU90979.1 regulatory protein [Roseateles saccharophilus]
MAIRAPLSLKARAIGLLAQREHSRVELRRKLLRIEQQRMRRAQAASDADEEAAHPSAPDDAPEAGATAVDALLDSLAADGYLDETRFVESRLHAREGRFGAQRIQQELAQHGLKLDAEQQATLRATELERAREVWLKRFGTEPSREASEQARQTRFLLARGFAPDVVRRLLRA